MSTDGIEAAFAKLQAENKKFEEWCHKEGDAEPPYHIDAARALALAVLEAAHKPNAGLPDWDENYSALRNRIAALPGPPERGGNGAEEA